MAEEELLAFETSANEEGDILTRACQSALWQGMPDFMGPQSHRVITTPASSTVNVLTNYGKIEKRRVFVVTPDMLRREKSCFRKSATIQEAQVAPPEPVVCDLNEDNSEDDKWAMDGVTGRWNFLKDVQEEDIPKFLVDRRHRYTKHERHRTLRLQRAYYNLKGHLPASRENISKLQILRGAIKYIQDLRGLLV